MTPVQKKMLKIAAIAGSELFLLMMLRWSNKTILFLWGQYRTLYEFHEVVVRKAVEQNPELFEDPEIQNHLINYEFAHMVHHIQEEK